MRIKVLFRHKKGLFSLITLVILVIIPLLAAGEVEIPFSSLPVEYIKSLEDKINFFFFYPQDAEQREWEGDVGMKLILNQKGGIKEIKVIRSSGYPLLDEAATWAIINAAPFPPPVGLKKEKMEILLTMVYKKYPLPAKRKETLSLEEKYRKRISHIVNSYTFYPEEAKRKGLTGEAEVKFTITNEGKAENVKIISSSGYPVLDKAAIFTVKSAQPYPSPASLKRKEIEVTVPLAFRRVAPEEKLAKEEIIPSPLSLLIRKGEINSLFQIARRNSYPLKVAADQVNLARIKARVKTRDLFPSLGLEYSSTEGKTITDPYKSLSYGMKAQHIVYDSGQRKYSLQRERLNVKVAEENYKKVRNELLFELLKNYYAFVKEKAALILLENSKEKFDTYYNLGNTLKEGNLITQIELLKIQNTYDKTQALLVAQRSRYKLSVANLKKALGIEPEEKLPHLSSGEFKEDIVLDDFISQYIKKGLQLRPEIALWKKSIQATDLGYRITKVENRPKFLLESFWGRSGEAFSTEDFELSTTWNLVGKVVWLFGGSSFETSLTNEKTIPTEISAVSTKTEANTLSLKMNFLDKLKYYAETQEGKVALRQAEDEFIKLKKDIAWEVQKGFFTYTEAKKRMESIKKELETDTKEVELKTELFKAGELDLSQLIDAEMRTLQAELSSLGAKLDMYLGIITLDEATGFNLNLIEKL